jgi:hypothetical protein
LQFTKRARDAGAALSLLSNIIVSFPLRFRCVSS